MKGDLLVVESLFGHAFGSVLAHAEAVTEAFALDDEWRGGLVFAAAFGGDNLGNDRDSKTLNEMLADRANKLRSRNESPDRTKN